MIFIVVCSKDTELCLTSLFLTSFVRVPHLSLCENPNCMMTQGSTGSQYKWIFGQHGLPSHMLYVCSCLSVHSSHIRDSVTTM